MRIQATNLTTAVALVVVVALAASANPASAATTAPSIKEKAAVAIYKKSLSQARAAYYAGVKPSRAAVIAIGKPAETKRRSTVAAALAAYLPVVRVAKAPTLAAQLAYRSAAAKAAANPTDLSLKAAVKSNLNALSKETAALKVNANVAAARVIFTKARVAAMTKFKETVAPAVAKRNTVQKAAFAKFKIAKAKALAKLKVDLKTARAKVATKVNVTKK